ncbi:flavodoxin [Nocardia sp. 2YAB30]|uniref:flavodoxin n=1 Tax=Nocardia sp. 2YAB30 TaxID=3233022 RepID=UPI003F99E3A4
MNRRTLLTGSAVLGAGALLGSQLACSAPASPPGASLASSGQPAAPGSRALIAYFSRPGENYYYGGRTNLEIGNTEVVAQLIASTITADVYKIEAADPYPAAYEATVQRNTREQDSDARPAIAGALPDVASYDVVLLGSGIWNVRPPMIMNTFIDGVDLSGKTILPFVTYAVSGLGNTVDVYRRLCPRSTIGSALAVRGEEARDASTDVRQWLRQVGLLAA